MEITKKTSLVLEFRHDELSTLIRLADVAASYCDGGSESERLAIEISDAANAALRA